MAGFEPTNGGTKIHCLATWLHPKKIFLFIKEYKIKKKKKINKQFFCHFKDVRIQNTVVGAIHELPLQDTDTAETVPLLLCACTILVQNSLLI